GTGFATLYATRPDAARTPSSRDRGSPEGATSAPPPPGSAGVSPAPMPAPTLPRSALAAAERSVDDLARALCAARERLAVPLLVCVCPHSAAALADRRRRAWLARLEERLTVALQASGEGQRKRRGRARRPRSQEGGSAQGVSPAREYEAGSDALVLVRSREIFDLYPLDDYDDARAEALGHVAYAPRFFTVLGTLIARRYRALAQPPFKVIAVDADQTLWKGVCGEDGSDGVALDPPRRALQELLVRQQRAGMLLCLCSKNNEADVRAVFARHPRMPLRPEHVAAWRVSWRPKSESLAALAAELGLGLDSFVVLDDDPLECAEVRAACPQALVLALPPDPAALPRFLAHVWAFDRPPATADDRRRTEAYRQEAGRRDLQAALTFEAFLATLALEVEIASPALPDLARVAQLTQRVNQLTFLPRRRSEAELRALLKRGTLECRVVRVRDRFGDYGLVGAMLFGPAADALDVDTFLLSCRALGRGVEHQMLAALGRLAA